MRNIYIIKYLSCKMRNNYQKIIYEFFYYKGRLATVNVNLLTFNKSP